MRNTGVYTCVVYSDCALTKHEFVTVKIIALTVHTEKPSVIVRQTTRLVLTCHSAALHMIYTNLHQTWEFDEVLAIDYGSSELSDVRQIFFWVVERNRLS